MRQLFASLFGAGWAARPARAAVDDLPVRIGGAQYVRVASTPTRVPEMDQALIWVAACLLALGLVMVFSATIALPDSPRFAHLSPYNFLLGQLKWMVIGLIAAALAFQVPMLWWERASPWIFAAMLALLIAVLLPGVGVVYNNARRWINFGAFTFQPAELLKVVTPLYVAGYMVRCIENGDGFVRTVFPLVGIVGLLGFLLMRQPDMGTFIVIAIIALGILWLGGVNWRIFLIVLALTAAVMALILLFSDMRRARMLAFLNPWDPEYARNKGYQLTQALIALGRGELWGVGLGASVETLHWLPEPYTDFLLAVIGEELGLAGVVCVTLAFMWLARRILLIGRQAIAIDRVYSGLVAQGIGLWLGFQAFIHIGVNLGALPTKGLTLPLMSYGGSALVVNLVALAIVLRVDAENRQLMYGYGARA